MMENEADERHRRWPHLFDNRGRILVSEPLWMPSVDFLAQSAHMGWGSYIVLAWGVLTGLWLWGLIIFTSVIVVKETTIDPYVEGVTWQSEIRCIWFYCGGDAIALATLWLAWWLGRLT